jgi:6-phosphogluconate dehydrogenase (decarboxylating)
MIGLGRMGANMVRQLMKGGHECVIFDRSQMPVKDLVKEKAIGVALLTEFLNKLRKPRAGWTVAKETVELAAELRRAFVDNFNREPNERSDPLAQRIIAFDSAAGGL